MQTVTIGKRGTVVLPAKIRKQLGLDDGKTLQVEVCDGKIQFTPISTGPEIEIYTPERLAEFFLNNVMTKDGYEEARQDVMAMGIDPDTIDHYRWTE